MIYDHEAGLTVEDHRFTIIASAGEYGYDWNESALLRSPEGKLYYFTDSGCSCSSFGDWVKFGDLEPVETWQEAVELAKRDLAAEHAVTFAERLAELRPIAS